MGKGPDQGDHETPTGADGTSGEPWPTEPASQPPATPTDDVPTATETAGPTDVGQLPTTSGPEAAVGLAGGAIAIALIAAGAILAWRKRTGTHW